LSNNHERATDLGDTLRSRSDRLIALSATLDHAYDLMETIVSTKNSDVVEAVLRDTRTQLAEMAETLNAGADTADEIGVFLASGGAR
jgi:hypothetical protein